MCNKNTPPALQPSSSMIKKETTSVTLKPARKTRSRTRKPKFLSLRLELSPEINQQSTQMTTTTADNTNTNTATHHHQLNLFPLHPEHLVEDRDNHDENVADFFSAADRGATTLTGLLCAGTSSVEENAISSSPSLSYAYGGRDREEGALVRTAMKNKERDGSEERWVCYSEVVERKEDEVSSCGTELRCRNERQRLSLKLDYEEILNAWSDKGPLYIHMDSPQTVPDLHDQFLANGSREVWGCNGGGLWTVPEKSSNNGSNGNTKMEEVQGGGELWKMGQREASVLRYKEKRQNRLFSKRIRYQVRKLNAEKRPRIKGRFVKRS